MIIIIIIGFMNVKPLMLLFMLSCCRLSKYDKKYQLIWSAGETAQRHTFVVLLPFFKKHASLAGMSVLFLPVTITVHTVPIKSQDLIFAHNPQ